MGIHTDTTLGPSRTPISQTPPGQGSIFDTSQNGTNGIFTHPSTWSSATAAAPTSTSPRGATWVTVLPATTLSKSRNSLSSSRKMRPGRLAQTVVRKERRNNGMQEADGLVVLRATLMVT